VADRPSSRDFDDLYRRDWARLCRFVFVLGATWEEACDVAQDAYVKLLRKFDVKCPEAWVRKVATRGLLDLRRKRRKQDAALDHMCSYQCSSFQPTYHTEETERALKLLQSLPPRQRTVMAWTLDGYEPKEIATFIGTSSNAVCANLRLARRRLEDMIMSDEREGDE
jgi:RNA polymerase sigma factor (sigma-70 family)